MISGFGDSFINSFARSCPTICENVVFLVCDSFTVLFFGSFVSSFSNVLKSVFDNSHILRDVIVFDFSLFLWNVFLNPSECACFIFSLCLCESLYVDDLEFKSIKSPPFSIHLFMREFGVEPAFFS